MPVPRSEFDRVVPCEFYTPAELLDPDEMYTVYEIARLLQGLDPEAEIDPETEAVLIDWAIPWVMDNADELVIADPTDEEQPGYYGLRRDGDDGTAGEAGAGSEDSTPDGDPGGGGATGEGESFGGGPDEGAGDGDDPGEDVPEEGTGDSDDSGEGGPDEVRTDADDPGETTTDAGDATTGTDAEHGRGRGGHAGEADAVGADRAADE